MSLQEANNAPAENKKRCGAAIRCKKNPSAATGEAAEEFFSSLFSRAPDAVFRFLDKVLARLDSAPEADLAPCLITGH